MDKAAVLSINHSEPHPLLVEEALRYIGRALKGEVEDRAEVVALAQQMANALPALGRRLAIALSKSISEGEAEGLAKILGMKYRKEGKDYLVHVAHYLKAKPPEKEYKLYYHPPEEGWVRLDGRRFRRIVEHAYVKALLSKPPVKIAEDKLRAFLPKQRKVSIKVGKHPPCIEKILEDLKAGANLSHYARWTLAVYLFNIGMGKEEIVELYRALPDFKEKVTRYHVDYIFKKRYAMPSCEKIRGYGLCVRDCGVKNPLDLLKKGKHGKKREGVDKG